MGIVIIIAATPVVLLTLLRANATIVFLSLCLGAILVQFVGEEAANTVGIMASNGHTNQSLVSLCLLALPATFAALFTMGTVTGHVRLAFNIIPAISVGFVALLLAEPLFSAGLQGSIESSQAWYWVQKTQVIVVAVSAILSLLFLWLQRPRHSVKEGKHHKT